MKGTRKKGIVGIVLGGCLVFAQVTTVHAFEVNAKAAVLMDPQSGRVLFAQNDQQRLPPASVTKLMTMLLVMEAIDQKKLKWDDRIAASAVAAGMGGSQVFLREHEALTLREMVKAIAVVSANDASTAVAEYLYASDEAFVDAMNHRAKQLGLKNTHFANETGLPDPQHYSSAYDLAVISRELLKHPAILKFTSIWMDSLRGGKFVLKNTNNLIREYPGADGLKTGHTDEAKYCLSGTAKRNNMRLISVILGAASNGERVAQTTRLLDYGFRNYTQKEILPSGAQVGNIRLVKGSPEEVLVVTHTNMDALVQTNMDAGKIVTKFVPDRTLQPPLRAGTPVGMVKAYQNQVEIAEVPAYNVTAVKKASWLVLGWRSVLDWLKGLWSHK